MASYDVHRAFENIPQIVGMELVRRGDQWQGGYYLDGNRHPFRRDKLKVRKWNNDIILCEEGGESMFICKWLMTYGGASDYWDAVRILRGQSAPIVYVPKERKVVQEIKYVSKDVLMAAKNWDLRKSPLFRHMCELFSEDRVRAVWNAYNVTANSKGGTVFWYLNSSGRICHDKIIWYGEDAHRIKTLPMGRTYKKGDGYIESPMFGSHFKNKPKGILESEKSALYASCYYGGVWLATGGKGNLRNSENIPIYADRDAEEDWSQKGHCVDWYSDWPECGEHSDLADKIEWQILHNKK